MNWAATGRNTGGNGDGEGERGREGRGGREREREGNWEGEGGQVYRTYLARLYKLFYISFTT